MKNYPLKFSIVTVVLNRREFIRRAIENVLEQNYPNFEHIIVDGASTDGTLDIIKSYPHVRWISEPDAGSVYALNKGLRLVQGDVFGWLNSDESYMPGTFHKVAGYFEKNPSWDLVYGTNRFVNPEGKLLGQTRLHRFSLHLEILGLTAIAAPSAMFMRVKALDGIGRSADERWQHAYDHDLWIRVAKQFKVVGIDECFSSFTLHSGSGVSSYPAHALTEIQHIRNHHGGNRKLIDRCLWIPYVEIRNKLYMKLKFSKMVKTWKLEN